MRPFHEGKACDAVIRHLEAREGHPRRDLGDPERDHHSAPVDQTCWIGDHFFAFEHTGIEPFEQHIRLEVKAQAHFRRVQDCLAGALPPDGHFELRVPAKATLQLKPRELRQMQDAIVAWVRVVARTLPVARGGRRTTPVRSNSLPNVPFEVALARVSMGVLGQLRVGHLVGDDLEADGTNRIRRAYNCKIRKLAWWQRAGARGVLILEESDIQMTNQGIVAGRIREIEQPAREKPDEIYLLSSAIDASWELWSLRVDDRVFDDLGNLPDVLTTEIDPATLTDLTGR